jgi:hypothetical protein
LRPIGKAVMAVWRFPHDPMEIKDENISFHKYPRRDPFPEQAIAMEKVCAVQRRT